MSSFESLSPRIISGYGVEVHSLQTGVAAAYHDSAASLWHPSTFPEDSSVPYYYVTVCLSLKVGGFWSCTWAQAVRLLTGHGKGGGVWPPVSLFHSCSRKLEYYCLFGVCSNQIRIETERVWKTRGTDNYPEEERHINLWGFLHLVSSLCTV